MSQVITATRNSCFALISSIESDLRDTISGLAELHRRQDILPEDVRLAALGRWRADNRSSSDAYPESDLILLPYTDFGDLSKILHSRFESSPMIGPQALRAVANLVAALTPVRNRVCHTRPLEPDDLPLTISSATQLRRVSGLRLPNLENVLDRLGTDSAFVMTIAIPEFWSAAVSSVYHNLPLPEFDDTGFLGRHEDRRKLSQLLQSHYPLVSVVGEGGVGKTALALRCLFDLVDSPAPRYDAVVWTSLKSSRLTPGGVQQISDAVTGTLGLLGEVAERLGASIPADGPPPTVEMLVADLVPYLEEFRVLIVIDNLEAIEPDGLRPLLEAIPANSKVLVTSRVGLGEFEVRYALSPMESRSASALARRYASVLGVSGIAEAPDGYLEGAVRKLFNNPLLIKWWVAAVSHGESADGVLERSGSRFGEALAFCFANLFDRLAEGDRRVLHVLAAARRPLSLAELHFCLSDVDADQVNWALGRLHNSSVLVRKSLPGEQDRYALSDSAAEFVASNRPPSRALFDMVQERLRGLRTMAEAERVRLARFRYDVFSVRSSTNDERIVAARLRRALDLAHKYHDVPGALAEVAEAKRLFANGSEVFRVSGLIHATVGDHFRALEEFDRAVDMAPQSTIARYTLAQFLMREMADPQGALEHLVAALLEDPGDVSLTSSLALARTRLGDYGTASELYEGIIRRAEFDGLNFKFRVAIVDQAADCYKRWAERDIEDRDDTAFRAHVGRSFELLQLASSKRLHDDQTKHRLGKLMHECLGFASRESEDGFAAECIGKGLELQASLQCGPVPIRGSAWFLSHWAGNTEIEGGLRVLAAAEEPPRVGAGRGTMRLELDPVPVGSRLTGVIKDMVSGLRYGFIVDSDGREWFFHHSALGDRAMLRELAAGAAVSFTVGENEHGRCAVDVVLVK